jgi:hypothetical protein
MKRSPAVLLVFKPASGYGTQMEFRNARLEILKLIDLDTGEVTEIDRIQFHHMLSNNRDA